MRNSDPAPLLSMVQALRGRPGHAFLVEAQESEMDDVLGAVRGALLCAASGDPCGECPACAAAPHPDWVTTPDPERVRREHVADWPSRALVPPLLASVRAFVVPHAERMTDEAANLLLKLLEEPPPRTVLVLATDRPQDLLPTLRSRCRFVRGPGRPPPDRDFLEVAPLLSGRWPATGWMEALPAVALALRAAIVDPESVPQLRGLGPDELVARWQVVVDAARDLEANANRDLVRHRLQVGFSVYGR